MAFLKQPFLSPFSRPTLVDYPNSTVLVLVFTLSYLSTLALPLERLTAGARVLLYGLVIVRCGVRIFEG